MDSSPLSSDSVTPPPANMFDQSPEFRRKQLMHFAAINVLPLVVAAAGLIWSLQFGVRWIDLILLLMFYVVTTVGIEVGYHRAFTHGAFEPALPLKRFLAVAGAMAGQGPPAFWVAIHRRHHAFTDGPLDPHSPHRGFWWAQWFWMLDPKGTATGRFAADILADRQVHQSDLGYYAIVLGGLVLPGGIALLFEPSLGSFLSGSIWGGFVRLVVVQHGVYFINSGCHTVGTRKFSLQDRSTNLNLLSLLTLGGSLHNNHHALPSSATTAHFPGEIDLSGSLIAVFERLGWARDVVRPSKASLEFRSARQASSQREDA
jgi:stearoyl-CoA desaturase (delta-9 desaturase)